MDKPFDYFICTSADNDYFSYIERLAVSCAKFAPRARLEICLVNVAPEKAKYLHKLNSNLNITHDFIYFHNDEMKAGYCTNKKPSMMLNLMLSFKKPCIWIDADSVFTRSDEELYNVLKGNDLCTILDSEHPRLKMSESKLKSLPHGPLKTPYYGIFSAGVAGANASEVSIELYKYINELMELNPYAWYSDQEALYLGYLKFKNQLKFASLDTNLADEGNYNSLICFAKGTKKDGPFKSIGDSLIWNHFNLEENVDIHYDKIKLSLNPITNIRLSFKIESFLKSKINKLVNTMLTYTKLKNQSPQSIFNAAKWYSSKLIPFKKSLRVQIRDFKIDLDIKTPGISKTLAIHKEREQDMVALLERILKPGMQILDCGSNIGYYPLLQFSIMQKSGKIYCIEPDPRNFRLLTSNINKSSHASSFIPMHAAISDNSSETLNLNISKFSNLNKIEREPSNGPSFKINSTSIDTITKENDLELDLIRMDIEGHEVEALRGGREYLKNAKKGFRLFFELHPNEYSSENSLETELRFLFDNGYICEYLVSAGEPHPPVYAKHGYLPNEVMNTDNLQRGIYTGIDNVDHIVELTCTPEKQSRYIMLRKENEVR